jgi:hypothetical protein
MNLKPVVIKVGKFGYNFVMDEIIGRFTTALMSGFFIPAVIFSGLSFVSGFVLGWLIWSP